METPKMPTLGEQRVRVAFNPSNTDAVSLIKQKTAELIDLCENFRGQDFRCTEIAQTSFENAAMWAVKAATASK